MKCISSTSYRVILSLLLCAIVGTSYVLGYQSGQQKGGQSAVVIDYTSIPKEFVASAEKLVEKPSESTKGVFFGSKSGTKYYGSSTCASAKRIKVENYVWFSSREEAEIQGYTRGTC